jgi:IS1 family transposase
MNFGHLSGKKTLSEEDLEKQYGRTWIWTALDAQSRLLICFHIGDRTLEECRKFFKMLIKRIKNKPLFTSDELPHYKDIILEEFHQEVKFKKTGKRGRPKNPVKEIDPEIDYATVHKTRENGKVVKVEKKVVYGNENRINEKLKKSPSKKINTAYVERSNGTLRQHDSHLQRKTLKFAKEKQLLKAKLAIIIAYYNFAKLTILQ